MSGGKEDVVIFLGAGFSADAGLPTMDRFGKASRKELESQQAWRADRSYALACKLFTDGAGILFQKFQDYCSKISRFAKFNPDNMEDLFCVVEALESSNVPSINIDGQRRTPGEIVKGISLWLWKVYHQLPPAVNPDFPPEPYRAFADLLKSTGLASRTAVLTTNYDLIFEHFAFEAGIPCRYPLREGVDFQPIKIGREQRSYLSGFSDVQAPLVCKLHGSINYFDLPREGHGPPLGILDGWDSHEGALPHVCRVRIATAFLAEHWSHVPAIVPPTYAKLRETDWLKVTFQHAYERLSTARVLLFIGYSLPPTDGFMRALLQAAMAAQDSGNAPQVWIIDPSCEAHKRYEELFANGCQLEHVTQGFKAAYDDGTLKRVVDALAGV